MFILKGNKKKR